ncbi:FAD/NAD(P)-binding protein [Streptomyces paludis]|uniref:Adenylate cyclase n=1 Tax=Streptomyces paludis TaxID=2282738 RepID=A0A345HK85_9ACTN|nr:FAD/NAD(P)-binding protein [Streptomyces paludis]AXG77109.1 adenylate cyclase [Streptomyces paludis]
MPLSPPPLPSSASAPSSPSAVTPSLVVIGAGPRGTGFLERIAANARSLYAGRRLDIHLVDPYPPGGGRIWRRDQSPLLWMNSMAEDVTMYTDDSVALAGPVREGPALHEWAAAAGSESGDGGDVEDVLGAERAALTGQSFPTRRLQSAYLGWVYEQAVAALPPGVTVHLHPTSALRVSGPRGGRQRVWLAGRAEPLTADLVVLTLGHLDGEPDAQQRELAEFARRHGLLHLPPDFTSDSDLSALPAGEPVLTRGFGLAFVDLMVLVTEGRGGRWTGSDQEDGGGLVYHPSGREPVLYVGSRRGVPYHSKIGYTLDGERPPLPRFLGPAQVDALLARDEPADHRRDVRPLIDKELGFAHYHRLFHAHPERTRGGWTAFEKAYAAATGGPELAALVAGAVPDPADRLDLGVLDRPLRGRGFASYDALQDGLRDYIAADLARRHDPSHSADLAVFYALLSVYGQLIRLGDAGDPDGRWHGFFSYLASGPPGPRLRQLLALSRAGVVRFLGPDTAIEADDERGVFRATSPAVPGEYVEARALVEARLPDPSPARTRSPLLRALYEEGAAVTSSAGLVRVDPDDGRLLERDGTPHPRRFALGPFTTARSSGAFTRPRTGGPAFRQNDATARAALTLLARPRPAAPVGPVRPAAPAGPVTAAAPAATVRPESVPPPLGVSPSAVSSVER